MTTINMIEEWKNDMVERQKKELKMREENKEVLDMVEFIEKQSYLNEKKRDNGESNTYDYFNSINFVKTEHLEDTKVGGFIINSSHIEVNAVITYAFPIKEEYFEHLKKTYNRTESDLSTHTNFKNEEEDKMTKAQKAVDEYVFIPIKRTKVSKTYKREFIEYYLRQEGKRLSNLSKATDGKLDELIKKYVPNNTFEEFDEECDVKLERLERDLDKIKHELDYQTSKLEECKKVLSNFKYELYKCKLAKYTIKTEGKKKKLVWSKLF
jgi:hypothetical protein